MKILTIVLFLVLVDLALGFVPRSSKVGISRKVFERRVLQHREEAAAQGGRRHIFDEVMEYVLKVFPEVFTPSKPMDSSKVVKVGPRWTRGLSGQGWRKAVKGDSQRLYHEEDVANEFFERYLGYSPDGSKNKASKLLNMLDELDELQLLDSLDEYSERTGEKGGVNPFEVAEKFVMEGLEQSFAPIDKTMNPLKMEIDATPFKKPVKLSEIRKVLKKNPQYFK